MTERDSRVLKFTEWGARIVHLLIERWDTGDPAQRDAIATELARSPVALSAFHRPSLEPLVESPAWKQLFGAEMPNGVRTALELAASSGTSARVLDVGVRRTPQSFQLAVDVVALALRGAAVILAVEVTDDHLVRHLGIAPTALAWSTRGPGDWANRMWHAYTGETGEDACIHPNDLERVLTLHPGDPIDVRIRSSQGEFRWHRVERIEQAKRSVFAAMDVHEKHAMAIELDQALQRERAARADAEKANMSKDQFLAIVSHELRAPLATLMMWEKVLRDHAEDPELRARSIDAIRVSVATQSRLVADLLDVSRAVSGKLHVERRRISLGDVLTSAVQSISPLAAAKHIELDVEGLRQLGKIRGDASRLLQVFNNLLSNAVKFTPPEGKIMVSARRETTGYVIAISDTGIGIEPEVLPRLFQPFAQAVDISHRSDAGLGLGLAISHELVALHDGELTASSGGAGQGATFTIRIPYSMRRSASTPVGTATVPSPRLEGIRILVIDDDARLRSALITLLHRTGAVVEMAGSTSDARTVMKTFSPDVIVCDISMPGEDGYTFIRKLRHESPDKAIAALALTAYATERDRRDAAEAGFDRHVAKPVEFERLVTSIESVLAERRAVQHA